MKLRRTPVVAPLAPAQTSIQLPHPGERRLGELLVAQGLTSEVEIAKALDEQHRTGHRLGAVLVRTGQVDSRDLAHVVADQFGVEYIDLRTRAPEVGAMALLSEAMVRRLGTLPIEVDDKTLLLAVSDPADPRLKTLPPLVGRTYRLGVASADDLETTINRSYRALAVVDQHVQEFEASRLPDDVKKTVTVEEDAPIVTVVDLILTQALRDRASDVHIEPMDDRLRVRFRVDGALHEVLALPSSMGSAFVSRLKIMADMNIVERRRAQDGQFRTRVDGHEIDVRVATTSTVWGEKAVLRLLDKSRSLLELGQLGMPQETHDLFSRLVRAPFGMVICSGPTGSGKTTTLYATLSELNRSEVNVMTIEDPVEYIVPTINQIPINLQAGLTFATGLRSILRQDPDLILVGEMRDAETARIAVQAALTGHMVLSSLHATDAAASLMRLLDMGIEPFLISSSVLAVVAQRLLRKSCRACLSRYSPAPDELLYFEQHWTGPLPTFQRGLGCALCSNTGYLGRSGVFEVLEVTDEIRELVVAGTTQRELRQLAVKQGMRTMQQEGSGLVAQGVTTISEIIRSIYVM